MAARAVHELVDYGPNFDSWFGFFRGEPTCVMTVLVLTEPTVFDVVTASAERQGMKCGSCIDSGCPLLRLRPVD